MEYVKSELLDNIYVKQRLASHLTTSIHYQQLILVYMANVKRFHVHLINYGNKYLFVFIDSLVQ